jgi:hypothetical protein
MHTDPDQLERLAELRATGNSCEVCSAPIERTRTRCATCPAPPRPLGYEVARLRLRRLVRS